MPSKKTTLADSLKATAERKKRKQEEAARNFRAEAHAALSAEADDRAKVIIETLPKKLKAAARRGETTLDLTTEIAGWWSPFDELQTAVAYRVSTWARENGLKANLSDVDYGTGSDPGPPSQHYGLSWGETR